MSLFDSSAPSITVLTDVPFPATIISGPGISIEKQDPSAWAMTLDYAPLFEETVLTPPSNFYTAVLDNTTGNYDKIRLDHLINQIQTIDQRSAVGDSDYAVALGDRYVGLTAPLTATRTLTLPPAATVAPGHAVTLQDEVGGLSTTNHWVVQTSGSDSINGWPNRILSRPYAGLTLTCDGSSKWTLNRVTGLREPTANYAISPDDTSVGFGTLTGPVTATLPLAASVAAGKTITVLDLLGSCSSTNTITVARSGSDLINGVPAPLTATLNAPYFFITLQSDGVSRWAVTGGGTAAAATTIVSTQISDSTAVGRAVLTAANAGAAQTAIGASAVGQAVFAAASTGAAQTAIGASTVGSSVFVAATPAAAQTALGLGTMATQAASNVAITGGTIAGVQANNNTIVGGTIDNTPIGVTTPTAGHFTSMSASGAAISGGTISNTAISGGTLSSSSIVGGTLTGTAIDNAVIGGSTPVAGHFTSLSSSAVAFTGGTISAGVTLSGVPAASSANPSAPGSVNPGVATTFSRGDHVHPNDTTKLSLSGGTMSGGLTLASGVQPNLSSPGGSGNIMTQALVNMCADPSHYALGCYAAYAGYGSIVCRNDLTTCYLAAFLWGSGGFVGSITTNGANVAYNTSSDARLKRNIRPLGEAIDTGSLIDALKPRAFEWVLRDVKGRETGEAFPDHGFVAQELIEDVPNAVHRGNDKDPDDEAFRPYGLDASKLVPYLVAELQALRRRVAQLEGG
jgi:hypothetical protein